YIGGAQRDAGLYSWLMEINARDLLRMPWFSTKAFYPYAHSLAFSDNFIFPSLVASPFLEIGVPPGLVFNLIILCAELLTGYGTFRVAYALTADFASSLIAGSGFIAFAYFTAHLGHPQLQFAFFFPYFVLAFLSFFARPSYGRAFLSGL